MSLVFSGVEHIQSLKKLRRSTKTFLLQPMIVLSLIAQDSFVDRSFTTRRKHFSELKALIVEGVEKSSILIVSF